jgi:hypothetical protein
MARNMKMELLTFSLYCISRKTMDTEYTYYSWCMTSTDIVKWRKTNDYENFEKGMIYTKILKKGGGGREKGGGGSEIHAPCACVCFLKRWNIRGTRGSRRVKMLKMNKKSFWKMKYKGIPYLIFLLKEGLHDIILKGVSIGGPDNIYFVSVLASWYVSGVWIFHVNFN